MEEILYYGCSSMEVMEGFAGMVELLRWVEGFSGVGRGSDGLVLSGVWGEWEQWKGVGTIGG